MNEILVDTVNQELLKDDGKVLRGKNGRLFLANDSNEVIKQHTGALPLSDRQLTDWRLLLEHRFTWLERLNIHYAFLVPPNAHAVYEEDLPDGFHAGPIRPIQQLLGHLDETGSYARVIYPLEDILAAKPNPLLYARTDSHWTAHGAFIAYRRLAREVAEAVPMHIVSEADLEYEECEWTGGLGFKVDPKEKSTQVTATVTTPPARLVSDNRLLEKGMKVVTECDGAPPTKCVVFGDSFSKRLHTFLASSFRHLVFLIMPTIDHGLIEKESPDVVISVMNERFLIRLPYDVGANTWQDWERKYRADGVVREELTFWPR